MSDPTAQPGGSARVWGDLLATLLRREDLAADDTTWAMRQIMGGQASAAQIAGFAVALRAKGESVAEVSGLVRAMYEHATTIEVSGRTVDVVGTGGDRACTVNISTMAAIVAAGAGAKVVKHGNRAFSSSCGTADVLEELGVSLSLTPAQVVEMADRVGITFCLAPVFHPALRHAAAARRELGVPTTFNFLGPVANPARPQGQALGVADRRMAGVLAGVLADRGTCALVFHGDDGLDELTTTTTSQVHVVRDGQVSMERIDPLDLGIPRAEPEGLRGGDVAYNAAVVRRLLDGESGPVRDAVLLNAAAALVAHEPSDEPLVKALEVALARVVTSVDSGAAGVVLERWTAVSQEMTAGAVDHGHNVDHGRDVDRGHN